ncbi:MAG: hypothetical protein ACKPJF_23450 [Dolichospermum sp.]
MRSAIAQALLQAVRCLGDVGVRSFWSEGARTIAKRSVGIVFWDVGMGDSASAAASSSLFGDVGGRSLAKIEVT